MYELNRESDSFKANGKVDLELEGKPKSDPFKGLKRKTNRTADLELEGAADEFAPTVVDWGVLVDEPTGPRRELSAKVRDDSRFAQRHVLTKFE